MEIGEIKFSDSPDFEGTLFKNTPFLGDIGQVSISTFIFSMLQLNIGNLWISVPDAYHQVILEPLVNLRDEWENDRSPQKPMAVLQKQIIKKKRAKYFDKEVLAQHGLEQSILL